MSWRNKTPTKSRPVLAVVQEDQQEPVPHFSLAQNIPSSSNSSSPSSLNATTLRLEKHLVLTSQSQPQSPSPSFSPSLSPIPTNNNLYSESSAPPSVATISPTVHPVSNLVSTPPPQQDLITMPPDPSSSSLSSSAEPTKCHPYPRKKMKINGLGSAHEDTKSNESSQELHPPPPADGSFMSSESSQSNVPSSSSTKSPKSSWLLNWRPSKENLLSSEHVSEPKQQQQKDDNKPTEAGDNTTSPTIHETSHDSHNSHVHTNNDVTSNDKPSPQEQTTLQDPSPSTTTTAVAQSQPLTDTTTLEQRQQNQNPESEPEQQQAEIPSTTPPKASESSWLSYLTPSSKSKKPQKEPSDQVPPIPSSTSQETSTTTQLANSQDVQSNSKHNQEPPESDSENQKQKQEDLSTKSDETKAQQQPSKRSVSQPSRRTFSFFSSDTNNQDQSSSNKVDQNPKDDPQSQKPIASTVEQQETGQEQEKVQEQEQEQETSNENAINGNKQETKSTFEYSWWFWSKPSNPVTDSDSKKDPETPQSPQQDPSQEPQPQLLNDVPEAIQANGNHQQTDDLQPRQSSITDQPSKGWLSFWYSTSTTTTTYSAGTTPTTTYMPSPSIVRDPSPAPSRVASVSAQVGNNVPNSQDVDEQIKSQVKQSSSPSSSRKSSSNNGRSGWTAIFGGKPKSSNNNKTASSSSPSSTSNAPNAKSNNKSSVYSSSHDHPITTTATSNTIATNATTSTKTQTKTLPNTNLSSANSSSPDLLSNPKATKADSKSKSNKTNRPSSVKSSPASNTEPFPTSSNPIEVSKRKNSSNNSRPSSVKEVAGTSPASKASSLKRTRHDSAPRPDSPSASAATLAAQSALESVSKKKQNQTSKPVNGGTKLKPPNSVLPSFDDIFRHGPRRINTSTSTGVVKKAWSLFYNAVGMENKSMAQQDPTDGLPKLTSVVGAHHWDLKKVKKVVVIGVHGWFPAAWTRPIIGEPTGTSTRFADQMERAIRHYFSEQGIDLDPDAVSNIPLEGEGKIQDRVNKLYFELRKRDYWIQALREADCVFLACHSQGTIVSTILLDRLIEEKLVDPSCATLLCMASISRGPFSQHWTYQPYLYLENEATKELYSLQKRDELVSKTYETSLASICESGTKVVFTASINDQVVPLYSGLGNAYNHPGILRTTFIDGTVFPPTDFPVRLIVFLANLLNANLSDHGLLNLLSTPLAGSLAGTGHSELYNEQSVYRLAVSYFFETTPTVSKSLHSTTPHPNPAISRTEHGHPQHTTPLKVDGRFNPREKHNSYLIPWALRGILEDTRIRTYFQEELGALRESFDTWNPTLKQLQNLKEALSPLQTVPLPGDTNHQSSLTSSFSLPSRDHRSEGASKL